MSDAPAEPSCHLVAAPDPALAERLLRAAPFAARRAGRTRGGAVALTWLDTAGGALAAGGLALEQGRRGSLRLLRALPEADAGWRPGAPDPLVALLAPGEAPEEAGGAPLVPLAAFEGRRSCVSLAGGVEAVLLSGRLRAVAAEAPVARLTLSGPRGAVLEVMAAAAAEMPLLPARVALAEEARALALGEPPRPRRAGAPRLDPDLGVEAALVLALGHLAEVLLWHAPVAEAGQDPTGVHQMRVALRRLRSLLRAFRPAADGPALRRCDGALKGLAAVLGPARDWDVWIGGLGADIAAALPEERRIAALLRAARDRREAAYGALRATLRGAEFRALAWDLVALAETRPWRMEDDPKAAGTRDLPLPDFAAGVLARRWKRLAEAGTRIDALPDAEFHALRLDGKRMRYVAELFAPLWGRRKGRRFLKRLAAVQEEFGLANDTAVARGLVGPLAGGGAGTAWAVGVAEGWALARARHARGRAASAWAELMDADPFWEAG
ncbi:CHAD domain-containing protein [Falsiroseomonas sp. CW058]|uniref:CHAD domain-containing protein n=1 Tax=Falsiroseomonas sp. CW058 TaxID=3388664 RepID=UPI003D312C38